MKRIKGKWFISLAVLLLLLSACTKKEALEEPEDNETGEIQDGQPEIEEEPLLPFTQPFTGIRIDEESLDRPIAVTINNHPLARPQSGISEADVIYEFIAEGNVTRFLAIFQSTLPEEIGPVRSARDYFIHMAKGLDAFYVAHGYSPEAEQLLKSRFVDNVNGMQYDGTLFKRSSDRKAPHNSYISGENILVATEKTNSPMILEKKPNFSFFESIDDVLPTGDAATAFSVQNGSAPQFTSAYTYDATAGTYQRSVNDFVTIDKYSDKEIALSNILVLEAPHETIDSIGRQKIDIQAGGKGLLFQAGIVKPIEWENIDGIIQPIENGVPSKLVPGKTWIHIIRTNPGLETIVTTPTP